MNKWMVAFLSHSVFQKADIVLLLRRRTEYNSCLGSILSNPLLHLLTFTFCDGFMCIWRRMLMSGGKVALEKSVDSLLMFPENGTYLKRLYF
jgi:hypothetical protein